VVVVAVALSILVVGVPMLWWFLTGKCSEASAPEMKPNAGKRISPNYRPFVFSEVRP
jgi:hypothetical protein